jgi:hypothetical protein
VRSFFGPCAFLGLVTFALAAGAADEGGFQTFSFSEVNGVYSNPNPEIAPVQQGPVTVALRSPANEIELRENRLLLRPLGGGEHLAWLTVELQGKGDLEADLTMAGATSTMKEVVELPPQVLRLEGKIRLERVADGYRVTAVELQPEVRLEIRSQVASTLVGTCNRLAIVLPVGASCSQLERSLNEAVVPLPPPGETFLLPDTLLTDGDRERLNAYLAR